MQSSKIKGEIIISVQKDVTKVLLEELKELKNLPSDNNDWLIDLSVVISTLRILLDDFPQSIDDSKSESNHNDLENLSDSLMELVVTIPDLNEDYLRQRVKNIVGKIESVIKTKERQALLRDKQNLISILPENYIVPNTKLSNLMPKRELEDLHLEIDVGKTKNKIFTYASINYDNENISLSTRQPFTPYDRVVHNAICTLYVAGNTMFTSEMVYRAMNGLNASEHVSSTAVEEVTKSIEKSRFIKATIDFTQELKMRKDYSDTQKAVMSDMLISVTWMEVSTGGVTKNGYKFNSEPILYKYSRSVGQVISVPINLLETKSKLNSTDEVIILREYLLRRIEGMKNTRNALNQNKILYSSIYEELGLENPTNKKTHSVRTHTKSLLEFWLEEKYIKGFSEYKEGKSIKGIEIKL